MAPHPTLSPRCCTGNVNGAGRGIKGEGPCFFHTLRRFLHRVRMSVVTGYWRLTHAWEGSLQMASYQRQVTSDKSLSSSGSRRGPRRRAEEALRIGQSTGVREVQEQA